MRKNPSHTPKTKTKHLKHLFHPTTIPLASLTALLTLLAISPLSLTAPPTSATSSEAAIGANLATAVHLSAPDFALVFKPTAAGSEVLQTVTKNVKVGTNNKTGYTLTMSSSSAQTDLINTSDSSQHILSLQDNQGTALTDVTPAAFPANQWGISTDSGSTYDALTPSTTTVTLKTTAAPSNEDLVPITVGAKANLALASGTYTNTMTFTAVTNAVPTTYSITYNANGGTGAPATQTADSFNTSYTFTLSSTTPTKDGYNFSGWCKSTEVSGDTCTGTLYQAGATSPTLTSASPSVTLKAIWQSACTGVMVSGTCVDTMQAMNSTVKDAMVLETQYQLKDTRDNKFYWVAKLKTSVDSSTTAVWMTQNLDYDIIDGSNIISNLDGTSGTWTSGSSTSTDLNAGASSLDLGNYYIPNGRVSTGCYDVGTLSECTNGVVATGNTLTDSAALGDVNLHYHVGNLYSAGAVTADSSLNAEDESLSSICPVGWRLPNMSDDNSSYGIKKLATAYNIAIDDGSSMSQSSSLKDETALRVSPLFFVESGRQSWSHEKVKEIGVSGRIWAASFLDPGSFVFSGQRYLEFSPNTSFSSSVGAGVFIVHDQDSDSFSARCVAL